MNEIFVIYVYMEANPQAVDSPGFSTKPNLLLTCRPKACHGSTNLLHVRKP